MITEEEERQLRILEEEPRGEERPREPENNQFREKNQQQTEQVEPTEQLETPTVAEIQQPKRPVGRPKKQPQQPQPPQHIPREEQRIYDGAYMGDNHIIGANEGPRTTRSGRHAAAHQAFIFMFTLEDMQETRETNRFIKQLK